jgi:hypothetical protein
MDPTYFQNALTFWLIYPIAFVVFSLFGLLIDQSFFRILRIITRFILRH